MHGLTNVKFVKITFNPTLSFTLIYSKQIEVFAFDLPTSRLSAATSLFLGKTSKSYNGVSVINDSRDFFV